MYYSALYNSTSRYAGVKHSLNVFKLSKLSDWSAHMAIPAGLSFSQLNLISRTWMTIVHTQLQLQLVSSCGSCLHILRLASSIDVCRLHTTRSWLTAVPMQHRSQLYRSFFQQSCRRHACMMSATYCSKHALLLSKK